MDITKAHNGTHGLLADIYNTKAGHTNQTHKSQENPNDIDNVKSVDISRRIEDRFSPSQELQKAKEIGGELEGGFRDKTSFENLSNTLRQEGLIDSNEKVAMDYLKNNSSKLSFDEFEKIAANDKHSKEMKGLIDSVVNTMKFVDSVNGGIF